MNKKSFLLVGASFNNKGAQAMIFVMINELRFYFPQCDIYIPNVEVGNCNYNFTGFYVDERSHEYIKGGVKKFTAYGKTGIRKLIGRECEFSDVPMLDQVFQKVDAMFDISGYNLSNNWNFTINNSYLRYIEEAWKYKVPTYIMPQSFGPFKYEKESKIFDEMIKKIMPTPRIIYCREEDGYNQLKSMYNLKNIKLSDDIVLQSRDVAFDLILKKIDYKKIKIKEKESVCIIPDFMNLKFCDIEKMVSMYKGIIDYLLLQKKNIYIIRHSTGDDMLCKAISEGYSDVQVILINEELECYDFSRIAGKFEFIIASRFHSIVHAYRAGTPCISIGWAIKYKELLASVQQTQYLMDVRNINIDKLIDMIDMINDNHEQESNIIKENVDKIKEKSCFNEIFDDLKKLSTKNNEVVFNGRG